jgi:hypothetical protein
VPIEHWREVIADPTIADAVLDRLIHNARCLALKEDSMRKIAAQRYKPPEQITVSGPSLEAYPFDMGGKTQPQAATPAKSFGAWWRVGVLASGALVIGAFYSGESALMVVAIPAIAALWIYAIDVLARNQR